MLSIIVSLIAYPSQLSLSRTRNAVIYGSLDSIMNVPPMIEPVETVSTLFFINETFAFEFVNGLTKIYYRNRNNIAYENAINNQLSFDLLEEGSEYDVGLLLQMVKVKLR